MKRAQNNEKIFNHKTSHSLMQLLNNKLKKLGLNHTSHDFRHTKITYLAN